jgi:hypothetical protein
MSDLSGFDVRSSNACLFRLSADNYKPTSDVELEENMFWPRFRLTVEVDLYLKYKLKKLSD